MARMYLLPHAGKKSISTSADDDADSGDYTHEINVLALPTLLNLPLHESR